MKLEDIFGALPVEITHEQKTEVLVLGMPVLFLSIRGPQDKDKDGFPEFEIDLDIGGADVFAGPVELDPALVTQGGSALITAVLAAVRNAGIKLPF